MKFSVASALLTSLLVATPLASAFPISDSDSFSLLGVGTICEKSFQGCKQLVQRQGFIGAECKPGNGNPGCNPPRGIESEEIEKRQGLIGAECKPGNGNPGCNPPRAVNVEVRSDDADPTEQAIERSVVTGNGRHFCTGRACRGRQVLQGQ